LSHGGPSALLFAVLHPERVSSLTLMSAGVAASTDVSQSQANRNGDLLTKVFQHDILYWIISSVFKAQLLELMGANKKVIAGLTPPQRELVDQIIEFMNPVALRSAGTVFDNQAAMPNDRISAIHVPTLIFHAADDGLQLYRNAEFAASHIQGAQRVRFERGGHLVICIEQATIRAMTQAHIRNNTRQ
jgi:pimeloyl-ACP methyl ester carboxylesterase